MDPSKDDLVEEVKKITEGRGADVVMCSVGGKEITEDGLKALAKGGVLLLLASAPKGTFFEVDLNKLHYDQSIITGSVSYTGSGFRWVMDALGHGLLPLDDLVNHTGPLEKVEDFLSMTSELVGLKKVILF